MKKVQLVQELVKDIPINDVSFVFGDKIVAFQVLRMDLVSSFTSGNKYFKLFYNILNAVESGLSGVVTYGGPFSNHLLATAEACHAVGLASTGFVRGTYYDSNTVLDQCKQWGMKIIQVPSKQWNHFGWIHDNYKEHFNNMLEVPVGGSNSEGVRGAAHITKYIPEHTDEVYIPVGSGGTIAGLSTTFKGKITGISVAERNLSNISMFGEANNVRMDNVRLLPGFWFGSFGKVSPELIQFCNEWYTNTGIPLDLNYTAKVAFHMCKKGIASSNVMMIHTGGLSGNDGYKGRFSEGHFLNY